MIYKIYNPIGDLVATFSWKKDSWLLEFEEKEDMRIKEYWDSIWFFEENHIHYKGTFQDNKEIGARKIENLGQFGYIVLLTEWPTKEELEELRKVK